VHGATNLYAFALTARDFAIGITQACIAMTLVKNEPGRRVVRQHLAGASDASYDWSLRWLSLLGKAAAIPIECC
jgi:hypothetical protein